ncbi:hypothetical protein [Oribacterium sp. WCC10]|uniref:hypothetical protein n=1 Tax=Oribacterium sp. WCC10 TaxID=1855343 RepID=UPI0008EA6244|nr:hypothetical protein [Oribacterium sp. WCC10]SFG76499.1 hypothetical protein SAMN05216356_1262 [Oribacterium sp. WCC10]
MAGINNIPKKKALEYLNEKLNDKSLKEIIDFIYEIVFLGKDIPFDNNDIYYYCRAFNIISYGVEHNVVNCLHDYVVENDSNTVYRSYTKVITRFPKGITADTPLFSELLETQLNKDLAAEAEKEAESRNSLFGKLNNLFRK